MRGGDMARAAGIRPSKKEEEGGSHPIQAETKRNT